MEATAHSDFPKKRTLCNGKSKDNAPNTVIVSGQKVIAEDDFSKACQISQSLLTRCRS